MIASMTNKLTNIGLVTESFTKANEKSVGVSFDKKKQQRLLQTKKRMGNMFTPNQILGRIHTIGCVAVEITQKCNLDCTLCYLSEHSQSVSDIPIEEVFRRLDDVLHHYGAGTHVQITGGDPTLRKHSELIEIVRYASNLGLYTALFTNGIGATRKLLENLVAVGLQDVAFHVDTTQRRKNGDKEMDLNSVRQEYLDRTKGLSLMVIFNTTVHKGNFHDIPKVVKFFRKHADQIGFASFQLQADTGRGEWRQRDIVINTHTVEAQIEAGSSTNLPWDVMQVGHTDCHHYLPTVVVNETVHPLIESKEFIADFMRDFEDACWDRHKSLGYIVLRFIKQLIKKPNWWLRLPAFGSHLLARTFKDLVKGRGRVHQLTFFVQNFMDASQLDEERVNACSFMVMTNEGPVSMCKHNASRDDYILKPLQVTRANGTTIDYHPLKHSQKLSQIAIQTSSGNAK